jgi:hypothetical protein
MKKPFLIAGCCLLLASCYKDDVVIDKLNTNVLDPDYQGPPIFTVLIDSTNQTAVDTGEQYLKIQVDQSDFPSGFTYQLRVEDLSDGEVTYLPQTAPGANVFNYFNWPAVIGQEYCYDISIWVQFSSSRKEQYCGIAEL